jgi:hypothetical protein
MLLAYNNQFAAGGQVVKSKNNYGIPTTSLLKLLSPRQMQKLIPTFSGTQRYYQAKGTAGVFIGDINDPNILKKYPLYVKDGKISKERINGLLTNNKIPGDLFKSAIKARPKGSNLGSADVFLNTLAQNGIIDPKNSKNIRKLIEEKYFNYLGDNKVGDSNNHYWRIVNSIFSKELMGNSNAKHLWKEYSSSVGVHTGSNTAKRGASGASSSPQTIKIKDKNGQIINFGTLQGNSKEGSLFAHTKTPDPLRKVALERFNRGGVVGGKVRSGKNNYGVPALMGNLGTTAAYIGGSTAGASLGQKAGGNLGSLAGMILVPAILQSIMQKLGQVSSKGASTAGILGRLGPLLANPYVAAGAAIVGVTAALIKFKKNQEESAKLNRLAFSGGVKPIKDFDSQLKQVTKTIEDTRATAALLHAQMNTAGLSGLTLTIKQFADLREKVKSTYPELVKLFKETPSDKLITVAQGLKAQFVAAGESASQANAKIAALLAESGKSGFIQVVLGDKGLAGITSAKTAIESMLVAMSKFTDSKDRAAGLLQVFSSMGDYIANAKDKSVALKEQYDAIAKSGQGNVKLTQDQIIEISKTTPELAKILSTSDDIGTALSKWRIVLGGVQKDLSGLDKGQLEKLAFAVEEVTNKYNKLLDVTSKEAQGNSLTGKMAKDIDAFNKKQATASKTAIQNLETQISLKSKQIEQIKKEGDERKKALRDQQQSEDIKLQIQQEQLNYQTALAKGDMAGAAQAQISIQRLVGAQQLKVAEDAIDKAVQSKIDALQAQIDVLNKKSTAVSNASSAAKPKESPLTGIYQGIQGVYKDSALGNITQEEALIRLNDLIKKLEKTPGGDKYLKDLGVTGSVNNITREDGKNTVGAINTTSTKGNDLLGALNKGSDVIAGKQLGVLQQILGVLKNEPGKTYTPTSSETQNAGATTSAGGTYAVGTIQNYTSSASSIKSAALKAFSDSSTGRATVGNRTYRLFKWNDKTYGIETSSGMVYDWDTNSNTIGKKSIGNASGTSNFAMGGFVKKYATAGMVAGPGTGTSDSIPAMLSNGEYVIRAAAVQSVGTSFLDGINKMSAGGIATKYSIPRMNMGGRVNMSDAGHASTSNALYNINVTLNGTELTADDVARTIEERMRRMQSKQGPSRVIA